VTGIETEAATTGQGRRWAQVMPRRVVRLARLVTIAVVVGMGISFLYWAAVTWEMPDAGAYWQAALRLRAGEPLYPVLGDVEASDVYRYAPWFAWLAVPFTFLPIQVAGLIWSAILVAASTAAVWPLVRERRWLLVAFFWPILIGISAIGNVHALMLAPLVHGLERRSGPLWIALAASLKAVPILLVLVYLGRREWWRAAATLALTALLVAPALRYDLSGYPTGAAQAGLLINWPPVYLVIVGCAVVLTLLLARSRWGWLAAATATTLALPRFFVYDVTLLLVGTVPARGREDPSAGGGRRIPPELLPRARHRASSPPLDAPGDAPPTPGPSPQEQSRR
jgi:hypothetical protein